MIYAPISGSLVPIEEVPDAVFSEKMLGDGVAILPSDGLVAAPIDGMLAAFPSTGHACGITTSHGFDILIHVGIDTVEMEGRGFKPLVLKGDSLELGQPLLEFDLCEIEKAGKSSLSPVVVCNAVVKVIALGKVALGDPLLEVETEA